VSRLSVLAVAAAILIGLCVLAPAPASAQQVLQDDPDFLALSAGWYDFNRQKEQGTEFRAEYRSDKKLWIFKPFADVAYTTTNQGFVGAGVLIDIYFGNRWVLTPSFAPQYYWGGDKKLDLGYWLEFRSQLELAYRFDNRSRVGLAISHYSNASLGDTNPGTEQATIYYEIPLTSLFSLGK
jgi:hypothetical protein